MPTPQIQNDPIINFPNLYKNGMVLSFVSTTSLAISAGTCRDSNNVIDIELGQPNVENEPEPASLILDATKNGVNGLDVGSLISETMYAIYVIADSRYYLQTACIATLASNSVPLIPQGYDSHRLIGYWATEIDGNSFLPGLYAGMDNDLTFYYDSEQTVLSAGTAASPTNVDLSRAVPPVANAVVGLQSVFTGSVASQVNNWYNGGASGENYVLIYCQVGTVPISEQVELCVGPLVMGAPTVKYAVGSGGTVSADVTFFRVSV